MRNEFVNSLKVDILPTIYSGKKNTDDQPAVRSERERTRARECGYDRGDDEDPCSKKVAMDNRELGNKKYNESERIVIMGNRMDFTDRTIAQVYLEMSEEVEKAFQQLIEDIRNICVAHAYKPMVEFTNNLQDKYQTEFRDCVMKIFSDWKDGEASLEALAKRTYSGEDAEQTARMYMEELENALQEMFKGSFPDVQVDAAAPVLMPQDILKINDEISAFMQNVENAKTNAEQVCSSREEENVLYKIIKPVIVSSGNTLYDWMKESMNQVIQGSELFAQGVSLVLGNISSITPGPGPTIPTWGDADGYM